MDRIGIFIYGYGLGNSPSLINAGKMLADAGFGVDYFTYHTFIGDIKFNNHKINVYNFDEDDRIEKNRFLELIKPFSPIYIRRLWGWNYAQLDQFKKKLHEKLFFEKELNKVDHIFQNDIRRYVNKAENIIKDNCYKCFIGAEPEGLIAAGMVGQKQNVPFIYYNLELCLSSESKTIVKKVVKKYEKIFSKAAIFTIIQDEERAQLFAKDNEISMIDILQVPVGAADFKFEKKTDWLREKFNLSNHDKIILYAGFISEWAMCKELAEAATSWPKNRILILHSHGYYDPGYLQKIEKCIKGNVKISLEPVPYDDLASFLASADIGIALYKDFGENFTAIGSASGKLAHYLKCGLPVIVNDYPSMRKIIDSYKCGVCINDPREITDAMERIFDEYDIMRCNAYRCYEDNFMFSKQFVKVIERIKGLPSR